MNKQEQIEKMTAVLSCDRCTCVDGTTISNKCPEMSERNFIPCKFKDTIRMVATILTEAGYINGADFVEWLKHKTLDPICRAKMENFMFDSLLQEYLKGE